MPQFLDLIKKEIVFTRLEIVAPHDDHQLSFNESQLESQLKFNGFHNIQLYEEHLQKLYEEGKTKVNDLILNEKSPSVQIEKLEDVNLYVLECKKSVEWSDLSVGNYRIEFVDNTIVRWEADFLHKVGKKVVRFLEARKGLIDLLFAFITHKIRVFNRLLDFNDVELAIINEPKTLKYPKFKWMKSDVDLLELVTAIYESGSISIDGAKLNKKDLQNAFELMLNHHVKDCGSKLSRLKSRKKDFSPYMDNLRSCFLNYLTTKQLIK